VNDSQLTPRELEVTRLIAEGRTNREIADVLVVSPETVKTHVAHILRKLELRSRHQVAARYGAEQQKSPAGGLNRPDEDRHSPGRWRGRAGRPTTANVSRGVPVGGAIGKGRWIGWPVAAGLALLVVAGAGFAVAVANGDRHGEGAAARSSAEVAETPAPKLLMNVYLPRDPEPEHWGLDARPLDAPDWGAIPPGDLDMLRQRASPEELAVISDGVITRDEFLGAFMAAHACSVEAAEAIGEVVVHDPNLTGVDPQFGGMHSDNPAAFSKAGEAHMDCVETYFNEVLAAWGMATLRGVQQPLMDAIGRCLTARGYTVPDGANRRQLAEAVGQPGDDISDFYACEEQASRAAAGAG
jgi:DNA-binding CsgD family transcriptional regulator